MFVLAFLVMLVVFMFTVAFVLIVALVFAMLVVIMVTMVVTMVMISRRGVYGGVLLGRFGVGFGASDGEYAQGRDCEEQREGRSKS